MDAGILSHIQDNQAAFKTITQIKDDDHDIVSNALKIVRKYISERRRIIYGGLAIDYALRLKDSSLYPKTELPDYDIYSPDNVNDAYNVVELLTDSGFENVSTSHRMHVQTMGVRINYVNVLDISFVCPDIYDQLPTLVYDDVLIIHPNFQRIDMHLALSFPFVNPPRESIFNRWDKDTKRLGLYDKYYPIKQSKPDIEFTHIDISVPLIESVAINGFLAYLIIASSPFLDIKQSQKNYTITITDNVAHIKYRAPSNMKKLVVSTPYPTEFIEAYEESLDSQHSYMGVKPETLSNAQIEIYNVENQLLSVTRRDFDGKSIKVASMNYVAAYFLINYQITHDSSFLYWYQSLLDISRRAHRVYQKISTTPSSSFENLVLSAPFFLSVQTIGSVNISEAHQMYIKQIEHDLGMIVDMHAPPPYSSNAERPTFNYTDSPLFQMDGKKMTSDI